MNFWVQMRSIGENKLLPFSDSYIMLKCIYKISDEYTKQFWRNLHFSDRPMKPKIWIFNTLNTVLSSGACL